MTVVAGVEGLEFPFRNIGILKSGAIFCPFGAETTPKIAPPESGVMTQQKHLMRDRDRHGCVRLYYRRFGRKVRIRSEPGSAAYEAEIKMASERLASPSPRAPRRHDGSFVYFILFGSNARVKIGTSRNPRARLADLSTGAPGKVRIYYVTPGDRGLEADLHQRFARYRINGEWFIYAQEIRDWIKADEARRVAEARS